MLKRQYEIHGGSRVDMGCLLCLLLSLWLNFEHDIGLKRRRSWCCYCCHTYQTHVCGKSSEMSGRFALTVFLFNEARDRKISK
jgi:hypothetical protein